MPNDPISGPFDSFADFCKREDPVYKQGKNGQFQCPCCLNYTLGGVAAYDICPVCFWEDDGTTGEHGFSPNGISLAEGQENFKAIGASKEHDLPYVRPAEPNETEHAE
jgi:Cysteine-rich CPCC